MNNFRKVIPGFCLQNAFNEAGFKVEVPEWIAGNEIPELCEKLGVFLVENKTVSLGDKNGIVIYNYGDLNAHAVYFNHHSEITTPEFIGAFILFESC